MTTDHAEALTWHPERPRFKLSRLLLSWLLTAAALWFAAAILPGVDVDTYGGALLMALVIAALNAVLPPLLAALRLPFTVALGFVLVLVLNAVVLKVGSDLVDGTYVVDSFGWALLAALVVAAVSLVLEVIFGTNDDDTYTLKVIQRIARRQGGAERTDRPGIIFLEIDGLALPVLRRAMRDGNAPTMARWLAEKTHHLAEWETDLSSQTGASQAGILLGSNDNISAFRWVEKDTGTLMTCSAPADCARIEKERATGIGLLVNGGASRGNLLSGEADEQILTVSRIEAEKKANPGYRAFFANSFNVTRALVLFGWEVILEWVAALRAMRRDVQPRGHRGGLYPFMRAAMCVVVRDLIVYGVLTDMMRGRPAVYATFSSYDEVAHHSGLERADTLEALRKLDQQFGRIDRARRYAPRPYVIVVLSDHGQTQGATFKQRNGYGLDDLVQRSLETGKVKEFAGGDEQNAMVGNAIGEATGGGDKPEEAIEVGRLRRGGGRARLRQSRARLSDGRAPPADASRRSRSATRASFRRFARTRTWVGSSSGRPSMARSRSARTARSTSPRAGSRDEDPLAPFPPNAPRHLLRTDGFKDVADIMVGSFYDPVLEEGCAFEELICFHGGLGGPQTQPFILHPTELPMPEGPIVGAEQVHRLLVGWRQQLHGAATSNDGSQTVVTTTTTGKEA